MPKPVDAMAVLQQIDRVYLNWYCNRHIRCSKVYFI